MIDEYAFLWDGSEPGWCLVRASTPLVRVFVTFPRAPNIAEVAAIRKLCPKLGALSTADAFKHVRGSSRVDLGLWTQIEAHQYLERGRALGLTVVREEQPLGYAIWNSMSRHGLIIEDDAIFADVQRAMRQHGVPVLIPSAVIEE